MTGKDNVLATNIDGLGIELYQGGRELETILS